VSEEERMSGRERREERRRWRERPKRILRATAVIGAAVAIGSAVGAVIGIAVLPSLFGDEDGGDGSAVLASPTPASPTPGGDGSGPPPIDGELTLTDSGLGIIDIVEGPGETPEPGDMLTVHYTGWLSDGTKFDSSLDRQEPYEFVLATGQVIDGFEEGLATMKVGGERRLIIPAELGYGVAGAPPLIPPSAELTFDVTLMKITKPVEAPPEPTAAPTEPAETSAE
jgi:peptidylprolyl isomerase